MLGYHKGKGLAPAKPSHTYLPMKMEQTECSKISAFKHQASGNYPEKKHTTFRTRRKFGIKNYNFACFIRTRQWVLTGSIQGVFSRAD